MYTTFTYTKTRTVITDKLESIILAINEAGTANYVTTFATKLQISRNDFRHIGNFSCLYNQSRCHNGNYKQTKSHDCNYE